MLAEILLGTSSVSAIFDKIFPVFDQKKSHAGFWQVIGLELRWRDMAENVPDE